MHHVCVGTAGSEIWRKSGRCRESEASGGDHLNLSLPPDTHASFSPPPYEDRTRALAGPKAAPAIAILSPPPLKQDFVVA